MRLMTPKWIRIERCVRNIQTFQNGNQEKDRQTVFGVKMGCQALRLCCLKAVSVCSFFFKQGDRSSGPTNLLLWWTV
jgi:hypothetical protein